MDVRLKTEATLDLLRVLNPDTVIIATGSVPIGHDIPGMNAMNYITAVDLIRKNAEIKDKDTVVVGGGTVGVETVLYLAEKGKKVRLFEMFSTLAADMELRNQRDLIQKLKASPNVAIQTEAMLTGATNNSLVFRELRYRDREFSLSPDLTVLSLGAKSENLLVTKLKDEFPEIHLIGDAKKPRKIIDAIYEG
ncbi:MAG: FAD-dependent oxidoreductase [Thermoplasmata archaeon]|nr:MAG: FAD-dependent oxidoreductase [Thermoplasmata archaeon]